MTNDARAGTEIVDGIPVLWCAPAAPTAILVHVPAFGQVKERAQPVLDHAVTLGFAAVTLDAYQHGARGTEDREALTRRVFGNFRREMWTIIGETVLDVPRVVEWARARFGAALPLHLTGLSMGGDVVVAAAPLVEHVTSVNAVIATPDWQRPGMRDIGTGEIVPQGEPDARARFFFDGLQPLTHPGRYRDLHVHFIVGGEDTHVPAEAAYRFQALVNGGAHAGPIAITELAGMKHLDFVGPAWFPHLVFQPRTVSMPSPLVRPTLPPSVLLETGEGGLPRLTIVNALARAEMYLHGAHVTGWQPAGHAPVLFMSRESQWSATKPIRGGVPICFPWFGPHASDASAPSHGFARLRDWTLVEALDGARGETHLTFELTPEASRPAAWPHAFTATYRVSVGTALVLSLEVRNPAAEAFTFEEALHTYFAVRDVREVEIRGLEDADYLDKVGGTAKKNQGPDPIRFTAETDRIYLDTQATCTIHDAGLGRTIDVRKSGSDATVVWNPWVAKARAMADFGDNEWPEMVCVETGNVNVHAVTLPPGGRHVMTATIEAGAFWSATAPAPKA